MAFKPSNYVPGLIPRPEKMAVPPTFTADIPVGPSEKALGFQELCNDKAVFNTVF